MPKKSSRALRCLTISPGFALDNFFKVTFDLCKIYLATFQQDSVHPDLRFTYVDARLVSVQAESVLFIVRDANKSTWLE